MNQPETQEVGERLIERLGERGVEYVFSTFGTDHPTLIKQFAEGDSPTAILCPHEVTAASAAHGYAQAANTPGVVLVHVDVGTANLVASMHNASRSRIPLFVMAGQTPRTTDGDRPGSRSIFVHWYQDVADQHGLVREYTKWEYELDVAENVDNAVDRGLNIAAAGSPGPTYLTLPREVLRENAPRARETPSTESPTTTIDERTRRTLVDRLRDAEHPLLITSYLGRDEAAVPVLCEFAETVGVPVIEQAPAFDLNFPRDHPLHYGFAAEPYLDEADLILVVNCDVPWVPKRNEPRSDATIVHIDADPEKSMYPMCDFPMDLSVRADARSVLSDLTADFDATDASARADRFGERGARLHEERRSSVPNIDDADQITPDLLSNTLGEILDDDAIIVDETVTNTVSVLQHSSRSEPGTYYSYCSSGLGWGLGASLGVSLARPDSTVVGLIGDGSFVLGNPLAAVQMAVAYELPHLTVIYHNEGWRAVSDAIADQYVDVSFDPSEFTRFDPGTDYAAFAESLGCHGERVSDPQRLRSAIERALEAVENGTHAILDVEIR